MGIGNWIVSSDNAVEVQKKSSMIRKIIHGDDILVLVCPKCMVARLALGTEANANKFIREMAVNGGSSMTGLALMSYCAIINDQCMGGNAALNLDPSMTIERIMDEPIYTVLDNLLGMLTFIPSDTKKDEIMLLNMAETIELLRSMHRLPLRISPDNAAWPEI